MSDSHLYQKCYHQCMANAGSDESKFAEKKERLQTYCAETCKDLKRDLEEFEDNARLLDSINLASGQYVKLVSSLEGTLS